MKITIVQEIKTQIGQITGLTDTALHMCVGLAILLAAFSYLKKPFRLIVPWSIILTVAVVGEFIDMQGDFIRLGYWRWDESLGDVANTIFLPTVILLFIRFAVVPINQYIFHKPESIADHTELEPTGANIIGFHQVGEVSQISSLQPPEVLLPANGSGLLTSINIDEEQIVASGEELISDVNKSEEQRKTA